jgi:hypothetical protein
MPGHEIQRSLPRQRFLSSKDKAGVSAIERAYLWSQIAKEGEVNEPIHSMLKVAWQGLAGVGFGANWQRNSDIFRHAS